MLWSSNFPLLLHWYNNTCWSTGWSTIKTDKTLILGTRLDLLLTGSGYQTKLCWLVLGTRQSGCLLTGSGKVTGSNIPVSRSNQTKCCCQDCMFSSVMSLHSRLWADVTDAPQRAVTISRSYFYPLFHSVAWELKALMVLSYLEQTV